MKYFAKLGLNSKVITVTHIGESNSPTEEAGIKYLNQHTLYPFWVETFKDKSQRKHFAARGYTYDEDRDVFIPPKTFSSHILNEDTCKWEPPVAHPGDGKTYKWIEETTSWQLRPE